MKIDEMNIMISRERKRRLLDWALGKPQFPIIMEVWPTFNCNLRCLFCDYREKRGDRNSFEFFSLEVSDKRWIEIIKEAIDIGVKVIRIVGGGEPFLRYGLTMKMATLTKNSCMYGTMTTNGTLFTEDSIKTLTKIGWDQIEFSVDGPNEKIHDYLRGSRSFKKIISNIKKFVSYKKNYKTNRPNLAFSTSITNLTYDKLEEFMRLAGEIGIQSINLLQLIVKTPESKDLMLTDDQWKDFYNDVERLKKREKDFNTILGAEGILYSKILRENCKFPLLHFKDKEIKFLTLPCYEPWYYLQIISNGKVSPCCTCFNNVDESSINNNTIKSLWFHPHIENIRNKILEGNLPSQCIECSSWQIFRRNMIVNELVEKFLIQFPNKKRDILAIKEAVNKLKKT